MKAFLSHTSSDKDLVGLVQKKLTQANAWYDAVDIENGESIPEKINDGLRNATHYVLFWSEKASKSPWVHAELNAAFIRMLACKCKFMIFALDSTDLPELLQPYKYDKIDKSDLYITASLVADAILLQDGANSVLSPFVNRTAEIGIIEEAIRADCKIIVLSGILGIGKSSLADRAFSFLYPNRAAKRIVIDFERIPGLAELSLELSRKASADFLNDNHGEENQITNVRYFLELLSSQDSLIVLKDVKNWLTDNGTLSPRLKYIVDLIVGAEMFNGAVIMTSSRYITNLDEYGSNIRQIKIIGLSDQHIAEIIQNNLPSSFESNRDQNMEFAKRLYGYPLGAKLAAYGVANFGYSYYLKQPPKIQSLKVSLAKQLISHAQLSPECQEYLKIVALCKSKLRNEEYVSIFPTLKGGIAKLSDEAFFAGVTKFDDDGCYQLEAIVEDYFYELAFALPNRKELCNKVGVYLSNHLKDASRDEYLRLVPVAVHVLLLSGQFANAIALRSELIETIVSTMWDQYNHMEYEDAYFTANSLIELDDMHMEARYVKALCLIRFDKFPEAGNLLNDLIEEDSQNKARYYYALGRIQKRQTEYVRAIELFEMSVCEKPRYLSPYREMAECYILMDNCQEAERCISKAHEIDDSNIFVILLEARLAQKQGRPDYAIDLLNSATTLNQESAQIFFRKGRALDQLGNSIEACQCYKESLQHNPKMYDAELCLLSHQVLSDPENAKKRIDQLKPKLHGKRKAVLQNIEARLIGYTKQHENDALELLSSVDCQYRDRQWFAVRIQLLENLYKKHQVAGRTIIANKFLDDMLNAKKEFREKYGADTLIEQDFLPDS